MQLNEQVRKFWEKVPCGTEKAIVGEMSPGTLEWYEQVEEHRYQVEPFIHSLAQFTRHHGQVILEVGVGAGTDHLQWARAGARCYGVDMTNAAINTTQERLAMYGFHSNLKQLDAELLPFPDGFFDLVYSWGVIHHSENPERIIAEIYRVLKPNGVFKGMLYGRYSLATIRVWLRHALLMARPWRTLSEVLWNHVESVGTKAYTVRELRVMFAVFKSAEIRKILTPYDLRRLPHWFRGLIPNGCGWFMTVVAKKS